MYGQDTPKGWPEGKALAVSVNIMCEAWTDDAAPGIRAQSDRCFVPEINTEIEILQVEVGDRG